MPKSHSKSFDIGHQVLKMPTAFSMGEVIQVKFKKLADSKYNPLPYFRVKAMMAC